MRKFMLVAIAILGLMVGAGSAQNTQNMPPPELRAFLDNYLNDTTNGPLSASRSRMWSFSGAVEVKDLGFRALAVYMLRPDALDARSDTVPFSEIIVPRNMWMVLIMAHNVPRYQFLLIREEDKWRISVMSGTTHTIWDPLLETYPETTGINPVLVTTRSVGNIGFFGRGDRFLYFEQLGPRKIYYVQGNFERGRILSELLPGSIETLNDSRVLFPFWREHGLERVSGGIINDFSESAAQRTVENNNAIAPADGRVAPSWNHSVLHESGNWQSNQEGGAR